MPVKKKAKKKTASRKAMQTRASQNSSATRKATQNKGCVALLGATGIIGSRTLKYLESSKKYAKVIVIDHRKPEVPLKKSKFHKLDLTAPMADAQLAEILKKEKCDTLIHTAMPTSPIKNLDYAHELIAIGTYYIFNACHAAGVRKVVMSTTTDVYGAFPTNPNYLTEDMKLNGHRQDRMLADRIDAEKQAMRFQKKNPDAVVTIFRHCTILGPGLDTYKTRYLRRPVVLTMLGYDPLVQFVHVDDLANAFQKLIEKDHAGIYNFAGDGVLPLSRVIELSGSVNMPVTLSVFKNLVQFLWNMDISPAPASWADFLRYLCVADNNKFKDEVGYEPKYSSKHALLDFVKENRVRDYQ